MKKNKAPETRSPLKAAPLRNPGQSLDEQIERLIHTEFGEYLFTTAAIAFLALMEWFRWYMNMPLQPLLFTLMALIALLVTVRKGIVARRKMRQLKLARDGEKAVGQYLENLREKGYRVLHDLVGQSFNVDHVLIGPAGVFTVETKTISKPAKGTAETEYDGEHLKVGGFVPDRDPIVQGKAQARWLRELLQETTGRAYAVRAIVLYPGWFVKLLAHQPNLQVLVLNPKVLPGFLEKSEVKLGVEDIKLITYHLSRHIRTAA